LKHRRKTSINSGVAKKIHEKQSCGLQQQTDGRMDDVGGKRTEESKSTETLEEGDLNGG